MFYDIVVSLYFHDLRKMWINLEFIYLSNLLFMDLNSLDMLCARFYKINMTNMNGLHIGSFYYYCYLYRMLNFMLAVCESWCGNFSGHLSNTCRVSLELIYNLINKRNIFVNYEHIISFFQKCILPFSFFVNSKHTINSKLILVQRHIWL